MNPLLSRLQPYPFERLRQLHAGIAPNPAYKPISLGIGEPRHATPQLVLDAISGSFAGLAGYPGTQGQPQLRQSISNWLQRRYALKVDPLTQILPVNGSREALFALAQTVIDPNKPGATVLCPNPFYQIYEGSALLAGAEPWFVASDPKRNFALDWASVPNDVWAKTQLVFVCSPGNPAGAVMDLAEWKQLFELSDRYGFVIASDECYSEIYFREGDDGGPPLGGLEAAEKLGRRDFKNLISLTSLSKRSNVPGLRSGFVAGDAAIIKPFLLYRTYHGSAMSPMVQAASIAAWNDEAHVVANRAMYRDKFAAVTPILSTVMDVALPDAGFYLWAGIPDAFKGADTAFSSELFAAYNVVVLPGSYLAREARGHNPGAGRVRMALVAETAECVEAAQRIAQFIQSKTH